MKRNIILALKGVGMGVANIIPGVSGGTIALIAGIYQELIDSIKSFDVTAARLLLAGKFRDLAVRVNLGFLLAVFAGAAAGIFSLARILDYLFTYYPVHVWAFFFGLILGSVYFVARKVERWSIGVILIFACGTLVAAAVSVLNPAAENDACWYLFLCGVVAMCSMILPGLSGSFILILMGNYHLVMIDGVKTFNLQVLLPLGVGLAAGLMAFSHFLSWLFRKFRDHTLALLTGFIMGSLAMLWPWKKAFDADGNTIGMNRFGAFVDAHGVVMEDVKVFGYRQVLPDSLDTAVLGAIGLVLLGIAAIWAVETFARKKPGNH